MLKRHLFTSFCEIAGKYVTLCNYRVDDLMDNMVYKLSILTF